MKVDGTKISVTGEVEILVRCDCGHPLPIISQKTWYGAYIIVVPPCSKCANPPRTLTETFGRKSQLGLT